MKTTSAFALLLLLAHGSAAWPQEAKPAPAPLQKLIAALAGTWSIVEKYEPTERRPQGDTGHGQEVWKPDSGETFLTEEYFVRSSDGDAYNSTMIWWNPKAQRYEGLWCADFNDEGCSPFDVVWQGKEILMDGEFELQGRRYAWHEVFTLTSPNSFIQTLDHGPVGEPMKRASTIHATRISGNNFQTTTPGTIAATRLDGAP